MFHLEVMLRADYSLMHEQDYSECTRYGRRQERRHQLPLQLRRTYPKTSESQTQDSQARNVRNGRIRHLTLGDSAMSQQEASSVLSVRWPRHLCLQGMARRSEGVLQTYRSSAIFSTFSRSHQQRRKLRAGKCSMGYLANAKTQHAPQCLGRGVRKTDGSGRLGERNRARSTNHQIPNGSSREIPRGSDVSQEAKGRTTKEDAHTPGDW